MVDEKTNTKKDEKEEGEKPEIQGTEDMEFAEAQEEEKNAMETVAPVKMNEEEQEPPDTLDLPSEDEDDGGKMKLSAETEAPPEEEEEESDKEEEKQDKIMKGRLPQPTTSLLDDDDDYDDKSDKDESMEDKTESDDENKDGMRDDVKGNVSSAGATNEMGVIDVLEEYVVANAADEDEKTANASELEIRSAEAQRVWMQVQSSVSRLSEELCEQLRMIIAPTLATQLRGDYRSGKRIDMKKVVAYVASGFKKDKIWLRRTRPQKRHYQVLLAIDDSESMKANHAGGTAMKALALIAGALARLEIGDIGVLRFGATPALVRDFGAAFTDADGADTLAKFTFGQKSTDITSLARAVVQLLDAAKSRGQQSNTGVQFQQIVFIISDGRFSDTAGLKQWIHEAQTRRMFIVFVIIDDLTDPQKGDKKVKSTGPGKSSNSILDIKSVSFSNGKVIMTPYMDEFPFPYYVILRDITTLPETLASALRQWFELTKNSE